MLDSVLIICCIWYNVIKSENLRFEYYKTIRQLKAVFELISLIHSWHLFQFMIDFLGNVKLLSNIFEKWWMKKKKLFSGTWVVQYSQHLMVRRRRDKEHSERHCKGQVTHSALPQEAQFQSILCNDSCNRSWNINPPRAYTFNGPEEQMILS